MIFYQSDKELEISKIKGLKSVHISGLTRITAGKDIVMLSVVYGEDKNAGMLCYTELDEEFPYFFDTIRRVYKEEKDNDIIIDEETKKILETNEILNLNAIYNKFGVNVEKTDKITTLSKKTDADFNMIKYVFESMLSFIDRKVEVKSINGIGKNLCLKYIENGLSEQKPFTIIEEESVKTYIFPGIFEGTKELFISIYNKNDLKIEFYDKYKVFYGSIIIDDKRGTIKTEITINGKLLYNKITELEMLSKSPYDKLLISYGVSGKKYKLPWNDIRIYNEETIKNEDTQDENNIQLSYGLDFNQDKKHIRLTAKRIERLNLENYGHELGKIKLKTIEETSVTDIYIVGEEEQYVVAETLFLPSILSRGTYKHELAGKTFYKVFKLKRENLESIEDLDIDLSGIKRYQLLKANELKLRQRKGEL